MKKRANEAERMGATERARLQGLATVFKALAHPTRLFIMERLNHQPYCVCDLTTLVGADTSTISKHLSVLRGAGLVIDEKRGTSVSYSLSCGCTGTFFAAATEVLRGNLKRYQRIIEQEKPNGPSQSARPGETEDKQ